jgi:hypothetical protein
MMLESTKQQLQNALAMNGVILNTKKVGGLRRNSTNVNKSRSQKNLHSLNVQKSSGGGT